MTIFHLLPWLLGLYSSCCVGIFQVGTGIPFSDFSSFGANEKDFTIWPTLDGNNSTTLLEQKFPFFDRI